MPKGASKPSPYRGVPRSEWPALTARLRAEKDAARAAAPQEIPPPVDLGRRINLKDHPELQKQPTPEVQEDVGVIPPNLFSGDNKTLEVLGRDGTPTDPIPGYKLYWFNDTGGSGARIMKARRSGYEFVEREEVLLNDELVQDDAAGNHVRKVVEVINNVPVYAYLMKKPKRIADAHALEYAEINNRLETMVTRGRISQNPERDRQYTRSDMPEKSSLPAIDINQKLYRPS